MRRGSFSMAAPAWLEGPAPRGPIHAAELSSFDQARLSPEPCPGRCAGSPGASRVGPGGSAGRRWRSPIIPTHYAGFGQWPWNSRFTACGWAIGGYSTLVNLPLDGGLALSPPAAMFAEKL